MSLTTPAWIIILISLIIWVTKESYYLTGFHNETLTLLTYNLEHLDAPQCRINMVFPLVNHFHGYVQGFSGYGQSLIEYNHYTNSASLGIAINDWI